MVIFPGAVKVHCANNGAWIGAMDFVQACLPLEHLTGRRASQNMPRTSLSHLPNIITLARIALVPVLILLLKDQDYAVALIVFVIAGASPGTSPLANCWSVVFGAFP